MYNQLPLYLELGRGYLKAKKIHHIEFTKDHDMFGFTIIGGAESNTAIQVTKIAKNGAADKDGRLRVRDIYLLLVEGVVYNIIIIIGW